MADNALAHGFIDMRHVLADRITEIGVERIVTAIQQSFDEHNRQLIALMAAFVERTTAHQRKYKMPRNRTLQPIDQLANPMPTRGANEYSVAFPIQGAADAYGLDRVARVLATVQEVNNEVLAMQRADADWLIRHLLLPIFNGTQWTFQDESHGALSVEGLANGDATLYLLRTGAQATATSYKFQNADIADATDPFETLADYLRTFMVNQGAEIACYINNAQRAKTIALVDFIPASDFNFQPGNDQDRLSRGIDRAWGEEVIGYHKGARAWLIESYRVPSDYVLAEVRGTGSAPVAMREFDDAALQGLQPESHVYENNTIQFNGIRFAGFGAWNRVGAAVCQINNASYAVPAAYASPPII